MRFEENITMENASGQAFAETERRDAAHRHRSDRCLCDRFQTHKTALPHFVLRNAPLVKGDYSTASMNLVSMFKAGSKQPPGNSSPRRCGPGISLASQKESVLRVLAKC